MVKGLVNKIIPFSAVDGPGNRTAIFLQGCNFNCLYCHNPETINLCKDCMKCVRFCPDRALSVQDGKVRWDIKKCSRCDMCIKVCEYNSSPKVGLMSVEEVMEQIAKVRPFISGITVSGGECTLQPDFLRGMFTEVKKLGLSTFVDTNGSIPFREMPELTGLMDKAMVDIKAYEIDEHMKLTGQDNLNVIENVRFLARQDKLYEIRTVIVPDLLENLKNVDSISRLIADLNPDIRYKLIKYRPFGVRQNKMKSSVPTAKLLEELVQTAKSNGCKNIIVT